MRWPSLIAAAIPLVLMCSSQLHAECKPGQALAPGDHNYRVDFEGVMHDVIVHIPPSYDGKKPLALMLDIHGFSSDGAQQLFFSGSPGVADERGFIVAAPTGYMGSWNGDIPFGEAYARMLNDAGFMKFLVGFVSELANVDHRRVYATGLSNGAAMSNTLGCQATDVFAGIAPVADPLDIGLATCQPQQPIAVLGFHGYADDAVPYEGGRGNGPELPAPFPSIADTLKAWANVMDCKEAPETVALAGTSKCEIYRVCGRDVQVGYCGIDGGHMLYLQDSVHIAEYAWDFLSQFSLPLPDADADGVSDKDDNCVHVANADQADSNGNCIGDACECAVAQDCDDGSFCNGEELCTDARCVPTKPPCSTEQTCDESAKACVSVQAPVTAGAGSRIASGSGAGAHAADSGSAGAGADSRSGGAPAAGSGVESQAGGRSASDASTDSTPAEADVPSRRDTAASQGNDNVEARTSGCVTAGDSDRSYLSTFCVIALGVMFRRGRRRRSI